MMSLVKKIPSGYLLTGQGEVRSVCCQRHKLYNMYLLLSFLYLHTCLLVYLCFQRHKLSYIYVLATLNLHIHSILFVHQPVIVYVALYSHVILNLYLVSGDELLLEYSHVTVYLYFVLVN